MSSKTQALLCRETDVVLPQCTASCSRWESINQGEPLKVFVDDSNWDPTWYVNPTPIDEPDPRVYIEQAMALWQMAVPCRTLFEFVDDESIAQVIIRFPFGDNTIAGNANCQCDVEGNVCVNQIDQSQVYIPGVNPAILNIFLNDSTGFASVNAHINLWMHELGHILGMGHVRTLDPPDPSVMGIPENANANLVLYDFDRGQMQLRYPCDCELVSSSAVFEQVIQTPHLTSDTCPVCQGEQL